MGEKLPIGVLGSPIRDVLDVGDMVQQTRKEQGLTQLDVAGLLGCGNRFVIDLEKGKPTIQMGKALEVLSLLGLELVIQKKGSK